MVPYIVADEPTKNSAGMAGETTDVKMGKVRPMEARKNRGIGGLEMAVYRLLDVVLSEGSLRMDEKPARWTPIVVDERLYSR